jgi:hypothetical protein
MNPINLKNAVVILFCHCLFGAHTHAAVIFTEDFESPAIANFLTITAGNTLVTANHTWSVTANSVDLFYDPARTEAVAYNGLQAVDLAGSPGAGVMETTFNTIPGTEYALSFHFARNNNIGAGVASADVDILGTTTLLHQQLIHDPAQRVFLAQLPYNGNFTADGATATIRFTSLVGGNAGITIDAITISRIYDLPGDLDGDGFVGIADLNIILANWNKFVTPGDLLQGDVDCDGFVGIGDLNMPLGNWNAGTPPAVPALAIPEPHTLGILAATAVLSARRLRR